MEWVSDQDVELREVKAERDRLRAALELIAIPPADELREHSDFLGCAGCATVAQQALELRDGIRQPDSSITIMDDDTNRAIEG